MPEVGAGCTTTGRPRAVASPLDGSPACRSGRAASIGALNVVGEVGSGEGQAVVDRTSCLPPLTLRTSRRPLLIGRVRWNLTTTRLAIPIACCDRPRDDVVRRTRVSWRCRTRPRSTDPAEMRLKERHTASAWQQLAGRIGGVATAHHWRAKARDSLSAAGVQCSAAGVQRSAEPYRCGQLARRGQRSARHPHRSACGALGVAARLTQAGAELARAGQGALPAMNP